MAYLIIHGLSYLIRTYLFSFPEINLFRLDPIITEVLILNVLFYKIIYKITGLIYEGGAPWFGSLLYLINYTITFILIWVCLGIFKWFGIPDIFALLIPIMIVFTANLKLSSFI